jgi:tetratricopeptide (TPR) repeat protein
LENIRAQLNSVEDDARLWSDTYLGAGKVTEAIAEFEDLLSTYSMNRVLCEVWMFRVRYLLGTAYEQTGRTADARAVYEELLEQLTNADPGLKLVVDTKARLAGLQS